MGSKLPKHISHLCQFVTETNKRVVEDLLKTRKGTYTKSFRNTFFIALKQLCRYTSYYIYARHQNSLKGTFNINTWNS